MYLLRSRYETAVVWEPAGLVGDFVCCLHWFGRGVCGFALFA